jgi:hypothetical protein
MSFIGNTPQTSTFSSGAEQFNGNDSDLNFTLSREVFTVNDVEVLVENVQQDPFTAYTVSGTTLSFTEAPPTGTGNIVVIYRSYIVSRIVPDEGTVSTNTIQDGAVTAAKLAPGAGLTDTTVSSGNYGGADQVPSFTVDAQGRLTYAANVSIETGFNPFLLAGL